MHDKSEPIHTLVHRSPFIRDQKITVKVVEKTKREGGEREKNKLSKHNFNLKHVCTNVKHGHALFLWKRKPVPHDVKGTKGSGGYS